MNASWLEADDEELVGLVLGVAKGELGKAEVAVFLREHCEPFT
jgi:hypothetical protein